MSTNSDNQALTLEVRVQPRSGKQGFSRQSGGQLRVSLKSPPEAGKANEELVKLTAKTLGLSRADVELWKGHKSRQKILRLWGITRKELERRLNDLPEC